jgi:hypothetical protein
MAEWTSEAERHLEWYLKRVTELCSQSGVDDVAVDLEGHIRAEVGRLGTTLVTLAELHVVLARVGTPEQVAGGDAPTDPEPGVARPGAPRSFRLHPRPTRPAVGGFRTSMFVALAIVVPGAAVVLEALTGMVASAFLDPMPTWFHAVIMMMVPISLALAEIYLWHSDVFRTRWLGWALVLNVYATAVSALYLIAYLPMMPLFAILIIAFGLGLLGLSPLLCVVGGVAQMRRLHRAIRDVGRPTRWWVGRTLIGLALAVVPLLLLEAPGLVTDYALELALSEEEGDRAHGIWMIRAVGGEGIVLERCYGYAPRRRGNFNNFDSFGDGATVATGPYRELYFRLTGRPFNSEPPPRSRQARVRSEWRESWREDSVVDSEIGGEAVATRIRGLSLFGSHMSVQVERGAVGYIEWTMEFKNASLMDREARAQIVLPHGGVASRLTLWIEGEEREAAFGKRLQVRKAYQEVAVVQRRDPALLTTMGPGRLLLQCFPVLAGGTMKVKVGVTAPLTVRGGKAYLRPPYFAERNFNVGRDLRHEVWTDAPSKLTDVELTEQGSAIELPAPLADAVYGAKLGTASARMRFDKPAPASETVYLVIDGSRPMGAVAMADWSALCRGLSARTSVAAILAGQELRHWAYEVGGFEPAEEDGLEDLAAWLGSLDFAGGCDPVPALEEAWDRVAERGGGVVLWVHGPMPVRLSSPDGLKERLRRQPNVRLLSVAVMPGPNRVTEALSDKMGFVEVPLIDALDKTLEYVATHLRAEDVERTYELALGGAKLPEAQATSLSDQLVRLAVYDRVLSLCRSGGKDDLPQAARLAVSTRLITPVSGAVVLETKQQYDRHGLDPSAEAKPESGSVPGIPEPEEWALIIVAVACFGYVLHRRRLQMVAVRNGGRTR